MRPALVPSALLLLTALAAPAAAQDSTAVRTAATTAAGEARRVTTAVRLTGDAPRLDGVLDDAAWAQAQPMTEFVQRTPNPGAPSTLRTEARVLYDAAALYVAVRSFDPHPDSIQAPIGRRDLTGISSDWVHVIVDSYNDKRTAFRFSVNAAGVQKDAFHSNDTNEDLGWDAVWESSTKVDGEGWVAEYRIPLSQLRFSASQADGAGGGQVWGLNVGREIARRSEISDWAPLRPDRSGFVSQFGELHGLAGLRSVRRLEVIPYTLARVTRAPEPELDDPFYNRNDPFGSMGADIKYGLTSNLTLTATINPDFGQVEADPSEVNLSGFESFFSERRPFFTEGSDIFRFDIGFPYFVRSTGFRNDQPFYSRRLGRSPQADNPGDFDFYDRPQATTILGAAKVSGKTSNGWSIGMLDALTGRENVRYMDGPETRTAEVEPLTNYFVGRAIKDFNAGNSAVGGIVTATHRDAPDDPRLAFLTDAAYLAGLDVRHRFGKGSYELRGSVLGTHVEGSEDAIAGIQLRQGHRFQRPDADHLEFDPTRTSLTGWLADLKVEKVAGGHMRGGVYAHARSPGLEMNDAGFERSTDWILQGAWVGYNHFEPQGPFRRWDVNANAWNGYTFGGERLTTGFNLNGSFNLKNNWGAWFGTDNELEALRADVLRGGPAFTGPAYSSFDTGFFTDSRRKVSGEVFGGGWREWETSGGGANIGASVNVRASSQLRLSMGPQFSVGQDPWGFVDVPRENDGAGAAHYVFADLAQKTFSLTTRASYAFTPKLTLEFYAQPFVATGQYDTFREVVEPRAGDFDDRFREYGNELKLAGSRFSVDTDADGDEDYGWDAPNFNVKELRSNTVLRWEYRPGSALFVVWSHGRQNFDNPGEFRLGRDVRRLFSSDDAPATNVLLVKVNYWLNL
jgi:hypothetical protein